MRLILPVILIYTLMAGLSAVKGISILNNSDARMAAAYSHAGISSNTVADYRATKGCTG